MHADIQLSFSLHLAREIGIEQAILWHHLQHWQLLTGKDQLLLKPEQLLCALPFSLDDLEDCLEALSTLGRIQYQWHKQLLSIRLQHHQGLPVLKIDSAKGQSSAKQRLSSAASSAKDALNAARLRNQTGKAAWELQPWAQQQEQQPESTGIDLNWQPNEECLQVLQQLGISPAFIEQQRPGFILWHSERQSKGPFNSSFMGWVKNNWTRQQGQSNELSQASSNIEHPGASKARLRQQLNDIQDTDW